MATNIHGLDCCCRPSGARNADHADNGPHSSGTPITRITRISRLRDADHAEYADRKTSGGRESHADFFLDPRYPRDPRLPETF